MLACAVATLGALSLAENASSAVHRLASARQHGRTVVFRINGIRPSSIDGAWLRAGHYRRKLSLRRVRAGARRGVIRVRLRRRFHRRTDHAPTRFRLVIVTSGASATAPSGTTAATAFSPSADAYVNAAKKSRNYGATTDLRADASPDVRTYLRFDIQGLTGPVTRALLKLYAVKGSRIGLDVRPVSDTTWGESQITYANAPPTGAVASSSGPFASGGWISIDITSLVGSDGVLSMALTTADGAGIQLSSREAGANRPQLSIETASTSPPPNSGSPYPIRGIYDRDIDPQAALGFNFIDSGPYRDQMDVLAARGLKGFIWLGGYSNTTCTFNYTDDWVRSHVAAIAGHPAVGAYYIDDEPNAAACPGAPAQMKTRSDLVKSIDPGPPTFIVQYHVDQFKLFAGTVDLLGIDRYPCSIKYGCDYSKIDAAAAEADRLGVRYWGVVQAHGDAWYRVPTPEELHQEFVHWRATHMEGYLVFAWRFPDNDPSMWLANNPALQDQLAVENSG